LKRGGVDACFAGVVTTPGIAWLTRTGKFSAGVMISASHNPFRDNGLKVFAHNGYKLPDSEEHKVEEQIFRILPDLKVSESLAHLAIDCETRPYLDFLLSTIRVPLTGRKIVIDCGNGAASALAPALFREAGAEVIAINNEPNGRNINLNCGALHVESLREKVLETRADAGIAFDGDADRAMLIAPSGRLIDGDASMLVAARRMQSEGRLNGNIAVSTVMANLGLEKALASRR
jgi:phosphoglucosamine mutase